MNELTESELRELDAELAKGMGWKYQQQDPEGFSCPSNPKDNGWWLQPGMTQWRCDGCQGVPEYSTDIAQAFEVERWAASKGWAIILGRLANTYYGCDFIKGSDVIGVNAPTPALAICLAAREVMRI